MLYPKKGLPLHNELFENPTSEYRGAPFWAFNCKLDNETLTEQIGYLKEMGFGGFHMHVRTGCATPYLSEEFMGYIKHCVETARKEKMLAYLYDEDRWPSGAAGGYVTKNPEFRAKYLLFTAEPYSDNSFSGETLSSSATAVRAGNGKLIACYDICLDETGCLKDCRRIGQDEDVEYLKWYAYLETPNPNPWYNNETYVNTLDKKAIEEFIRITHESYKKAVGDDFGGVIPSIFTDEPQFSHKTTLSFAAEKKDVILPWTDDIHETFKNAYGYDILDCLPELIWELPEGKVSAARYSYHDHIAERFAGAFADSCGSWCKKNNLMLTGHMMEEPTLFSQTAALGEAMRSYRSFGLPGIDMLCDWFEYTTAKQAQSASHQFGCPGVLSELYGVTGWAFDFRGHKIQGDWQAALGVTVRVPHLSWVSMAGEAKRDYPASINYQSPWFREYPLIEDHFARINTALTRGKPVVRVGVIHPIESYWLHWGPNEQTALLRLQMDKKFSDLTEWLLFGLIDFDFICESLLPEQCRDAGAPLSVGEMDYDVIIVPGCETLRLTTVERLERFVDAGGRLIFMGDTPKYIGAKPDARVEKLYQRVQPIPYEEFALLTALEPERLVDIRDKSGSRVNNLIYNMREDTGCKWLFIAKGKKPQNPDVAAGTECKIYLKGAYAPEVYDTCSGEIYPVHAEYQHGCTVISKVFFEHDSLLLKLVNGMAEANSKAISDKVPESKSVPQTIMTKVDVTLSEPNVLLLDLAEYAFDQEDFQAAEEILIIDNKFREKLCWPSRMEAVAQPWTIKQEKAEHTLSLRFDITSEIEVKAPLLALEDAENVFITFNGERVNSAVKGYYVDKSIKTVELPPVKKGKNILILQLQFGKRTDTECCYLLGDFGVRVAGCEKVITPPVSQLAFGDITSQGLPFYGGNVTYSFDVVSPGRDLMIKASQYRGSLITVSLDGDKAGKIVFSPYMCNIKNAAAGKHNIGLTLYGNRANTFGPVHNADPNFSWLGPNSWRTTGDNWCYEYKLKETGILKSPELYL